MLVNELNGCGSESRYCHLKNNDLSVKKLFIEIRLCNRMKYVFKGHIKILKIYMLKFNVSILNRPKQWFFGKYKVYTKI